MKLFAFIALFASAAVGIDAHKLGSKKVENATLFGNVIDKLVLEGFEFVRLILEDNEPLSVPDLPALDIVDDNVTLNVLLTSVKLSQASDFVVNELSNDLANKNVSFEVALPSLHLEGVHNISGSALDEEVTGSGTFSVNLTNFVQDGQIQLAIQNSSLQINSLGLQYDLDSASFNITGLETTSLSNEQIENFLNTELLNFLKQNQAIVCEKVAEHVTTIANALMKKKTLVEIIQWLKSKMSS